MSPQKISLLQDLVISQIAAGEVIQRPASALKELMENALDAGATEIKVFYEEGGKKSLQVMDNGTGMTPEDARLCFTQHATSKLQAIDDLSKLHTYGFRGEAMSSIRAAAARVVLKTKTEEAELGTQITIESGKIIGQEPIQMERGTQASVYHLFGNIPARLHFLKSNSIESSHIVDTFQQIAIAKPEITFSLYQNKKEIYLLPRTKKVSQRIIHLLGKNYQTQLIPCAEETASVSIQGYIGRPEQARKTGKKHFLYVNKRYIKSRYLHHAVKKAFENLIPEEKSPFYTLFITLDPKKVDVNVHPTKAEVHFEEEKLIYALIASSIRKALSTHQIIPSIDFERENYTTFPFSSHQRIDLAPILPQKEEDTKWASPQKLWSSFEPKEQEEEKEFFEKKSRERASPNQSREGSPPRKLQVHEQYIIVPVKSGILFIDQQKAYERIFYEQTERKRTQEVSHIQRLLFPIPISLDPADFTLIQSCRRTIHDIGFDFEIKDQNQLVITGQPIGMKLDKLADLFLSILEEYKSHLQENIGKRESWIRALAKKACTQYTRQLTPEEMDALLDQLFRCENPNYTPSGKRIWKIIPLTSIETIITDDAILDRSSS